MCLTAEHFKYGGGGGGGKILLEPVAKVVNCIIKSGEIPNTFKEGVITPVYKKQGKPLQDPNSYSCQLQTDFPHLHPVQGPRTYTV